VNILNEISQSI